VLSWLLLLVLLRQALLLQALPLASQLMQLQVHQPQQQLLPLLRALLCRQKPLLLLPVRQQTQQAPAALCKQQTVQEPGKLRCCSPHAPQQLHPQQTQQRQQQQQKL
jgi:hypothetical protein